MKAQDRNFAFLWDMREAALLVVDFLSGIPYAAYESDKLLQSAVERQLEIIGEAAHHVTVEFQQAHSEISWRSIIGLRNILIHEYGDVRIDRVWMVATDHIPELINQLTPLIPPVEDE